MHYSPVMGYDKDMNSSDKGLAQLYADDIPAGLIVTFDDPHESGIRMVASYIPGGVTEDGELLDVVWTDAYGSRWKLEDILANHPQVINSVARLAQAMPANTHPEHENADTGSTK